MVQAIVRCADLDAAIAAYEQLGLRLDMIMPADAPRVADLSGHGLSLRLIVERFEGDDGKTIWPIAKDPAFSITRAGAAWSDGRAGMQYRDLIPGRLDGRAIASHIKIPDGGPVADYVHFHSIVFQMIYCRRGWVRVVYEDQGPPFVMNEGDCVLQPPGIRHRVLESSQGLEVIEVSAPAEHETFREHTLQLPTSRVHADRIYGNGQHFVRHIAAGAPWYPRDGFETRDTGIAKATDGRFKARVLRAPAGTKASLPRLDRARFLFVLTGDVTLRATQIGEHLLDTDDACVLPADIDFAITPQRACEILEIALPV